MIREPRTILEVSFPFRVSTAKGRHFKFDTFKLLDLASHGYNVHGPYELIVLTSDKVTVHAVWKWMRELREAVETVSLHEYKDESAITVGNSQLTIYGLWPHEYQELIDGRTEIMFSVDHCDPIELQRDNEASQ